jgi:site-specific DNA recombinase
MALDQATITHRMVRGKAFAARKGRYVGGRVPLGYTLNTQGRLVPSLRIVGSQRQTEADLVREVFAHIAQGSTVEAQVQRLTALGVPVRWRYGTHLVGTARPWTAQRLLYMLHNPVYKGLRIFHGQQGEIVTPVPALVDATTWETVQQQLTQNLRNEKGNQTRRYLLKGTLRCGLCEGRYVGERLVLRGVERYYYRCNRHRRRGQPVPICRSPRVPALTLEADIWTQCRQAILHPTRSLTRQRLAAYRSELALIEAEDDIRTQRRIVSLLIDVIWIDPAPLPQRWEKRVVWVRG